MISFFHKAKAVKFSREVVSTKISRSMAKTYL